ncbi:MAG: EAL domain-containing protein [Sandaracinaceae bacterium]
MARPGHQPILEQREHAAEPPLRIPIHALPFRIGRAAGMDLVLSSPRVSKLHCEIAVGDDQLVLRDLASRNGTFVNGERVDGEQVLQDGDLIVVAGRELRFAYVDLGSFVEESTQAGHPSPSVVAFHQQTRDLFRILAGPAVRAVFQPIVTLDGTEIVGFEALGRQTLPTLSFEVAELFRIAHDRGKAEELAAVMRTAALADVPGLPDAQRLFMNVHPAEMQNGVLLRELERSRRALGASRRLVAEIHESAVTDPSLMRGLRADLASLDIELAYDDFGAGQARLREIAEAPPDFVKLDITLIHEIDQSLRRQDLVAALVKVMREAGIQVVAEGVETREEARVCAALGCDLAQGFFFRHPLPVHELHD